MPGLKERLKKTLEAQTVAAHRAYVDALVVWERALHQATCPRCRPTEIGAEELGRRCEIAGEAKERRRIAFRDLSDALGYVPRGLGVALPPEEEDCGGDSALN